MDFNLNEEQKMLVDTIRTMGEREKFKELARHIDETGEFPFDLMKKYAELGLLGMTVSSEYGGGGQPAMNAILCIEELAKFSPMIAAPVFESNVGPVRVIDLFGTDEQKKAIIPGVCGGDLSVSVCMTEPEAGSDLTALTTRAVEDGDSYVLNGRKCFITGGGHASHYMVYTRFGDIKGYKGIGGLLVEKGDAGLHLRQAGEIHGAQGHAVLRSLLRRRQGARRKTWLSRRGISTSSCGPSTSSGAATPRCAWASPAARSRKRRPTPWSARPSGGPICEFQAVQFMMVDIATKLDAARLLVYRAVNGAGQGLPSIYEASMAKAYANEMVVDVTNTAMQVFGGYGYSTEFPMERMYRDAKAWGVAGGTMQMLKIGIASMIFGRRFDQRKA